MSPDDWTESYNQMSSIDPTTPFAINLLMAKTKLITALHAFLGLLVLFSLAVIVPVVVIAWRAAF